MTGGRPTEYKAETIAKQVERYIDLCKSQSFLPTIEGLAVHLCVARQTLYDWADPKSERFHEEFSYIFEQLKAAQASQLLQNGLVGVYNSTITELMLTKRGYKDKSDVTGDDKQTEGNKIVLTDFKSGTESQ